MRRVVILFFTAFGAIACFSQTSNTALFDQATRQYSQGNYDQALKTYKSILGAGQHSAEVYYNMGNVYYKMDSLPLSIYYYEKALQLSPNDADAKANLAFANQKILDLVEPLPKSFLSNISELLQIFYFDTWAILGVIFMFVFSVAFLLYYFSKSVILKKSFFILSFCFLALSLSCLSFGHLEKYRFQNKKYGIISSATVDVASEPTAVSDAVFQIHEGLKVEVDESFESWYKIKLADGKTGWILSKSLMLL